MFYIKYSGSDEKKGFNLNKPAEGMNKMQHKKTSGLVKQLRYGIVLTTEDTLCERLLQVIGEGENDGVYVSSVEVKRSLTDLEGGLEAIEIEVYFDAEIKNKIEDLPKRANRR